MSAICNSSYELKFYKNQILMVKKKKKENSQVNAVLQQEKLSLTIYQVQIKPDSKELEWMKFFQGRKVNLKVRIGKNEH